MTVKCLVQQVEVDEGGLRQIAVYSEMPRKGELVWVGDKWWGVRQVGQAPLGENNPTDVWSVHVWVVPA